MKHPGIDTALLLVIRYNESSHDRIDECRSQHSDDREEHCYDLLLLLLGTTPNSQGQ
jgi:hypothetical protein